MPGDIMGIEHHQLMLEKPDKAEIALRERIAIALWHRFAPEHHMEWSEEHHQTEYLDAADAVLILTRPRRAGQGGLDP